MGWKDNISEGINRLAIVLTAIIGGLTLLIAIPDMGFFSGVLVALIVSVIVYGVVSLIHYIIKGFLGK